MKVKHVVGEAGCVTWHHQVVWLVDISMGLLMHLLLVVGSVRRRADLSFERVVLIEIARLLYVAHIALTLILRARFAVNRLLLVTADLHLEVKMLGRLWKHAFLATDL